MMILLRGDSQKFEGVPLLLGVAHVWEWDCWKMVTADVDAALQFQTSDSY